MQRIALCKQTRWSGSWERQIVKYINRGITAGVVLSRKFANDTVRCLPISLSALVQSFPTDDSLDAAHYFTIALPTNSRLVFTIASILRFSVTPEKHRF